MTNKSTTPVNIKHLRVRETDELGGKRYHGRCGSNGLQSRDYVMTLAQTTCPACLSGLRKVVK